MEDDGTAAGATRRRPHVCAVGRDTREEDYHAVGADVSLRVRVAEGESVGGFRNEFVRHCVVATKKRTKELTYGEVI